MAEPLDPSGEPRAYALRVDRREDEDHPRAPGPEPAASPMSRHAAEWGLASLLTGGAMLLLTSVVMVFALIFWINGREIVGTAADWANKLTLVGAVIAALVLIALTGASLAVGIRALQSASQRRQPAGLALAGTMVSAVALLLFTLMAIGTLMVILTFM